MSRHKGYGRAIRNCILLLLVMNSFGCGLSGFLNPSVHYVLPDRYVGVFKIILDESSGVSVNRKGWRYTYEIPPSGILRIKSFAPIEQWHEETAAYRNGTKLLIPDSTVSDGAVALRSLGTYTRGDGPPTMTFVIGTKAQEDELRAKMDSIDFDKIPLQSNDHQ